MAHWLLKSEPSAWSWEDQVKAGVDSWDGVRNFQAAANLKAMRSGDTGFFYHSVKEKRIVGIVEVVREHHPDPSDPSGRFGMVDVRALQPLRRPVTLEEIKAHPHLRHLPLVRQARLSVMPIDDESWRIICEMGGVAPA